MRYWRIQLSPGGGRPFWCKAEKVTPERVVLQADQSLPKGVACNMQITLPALHGRKQPVSAGLAGEVEHAIFSGGKVHLSLRVKWLSGEARQLIDGVVAGESEAARRK